MRPDLCMPSRSPVVGMAGGEPGDVENFRPTSSASLRRKHSELNCSQASSSSVQGPLWSHFECVQHVGKD